jgi:O-antigen ligase
LRHGQPDIVMTVRANEVGIGERLQWLMLFAFGTVSVYASRSIVAVLLVLAVLSLMNARGSRRLLAGADPVMLAGLVSLLLLGALSGAWSLDAGESLHTWWRVALILSAGGVLAQYLVRNPEGNRDRGMDLLAGGLCLGIGLLLLEWAFDGRPGSALKGHDGSGLNFTSHAVAVLVVLMWPAGWWLWRRAGALACTAAAIAAVSAVVLLPLAAGVLAIIAGVLVWVAVRGCGRRGVLLLLVTVWLVGLAAPALFSYGSSALLHHAAEAVPTSWRHRLVIWQYFAGRVAQRPLLGYGMASAHRSTDDAEALQHYARLARSVGGSDLVAHPPLHPHNSILQLWHDLGVVGVLCALTLITGFLRRVMVLPRATAAWICAGFVSWSSIACVSFGLWQKWWLAAAAIAFAVGRVVASSPVANGPIAFRGKDGHA